MQSPRNSSVPLQLTASITIGNEGLGGKTLPSTATGAEDNQEALNSTTTTLLKYYVAQGYLQQED